VKVVSVVGARPQFVKLSPIAKAAADRVQHLIVHTGQHYDHLMSDVFFSDLGIPSPEYNLGVGSGKHGAQTAAMLDGLEGVFESVRPDCVLVYGDTNSTLAAAIAAVKMHIPVAHLEAGLRSFNRRMPEEHNRVLTDHSSDLLLAPTVVARDHLIREGLGARTVVVGDVMTDVLYSICSAVQRNEAPFGLISGEYYLATIHRPDNTDSRDRLEQIIGSLGNLDKPVALLAHPRLVDQANRHGVKLERGSIRVLPPLSYPELVRATMSCAGVVTDSGGLQKEAFLLRVPCTTVRPETEWVETLTGGWNVLVGENLDSLAEIARRAKPSPIDLHPYGDGNAAQRTIDTLLERIGSLS
jgi:UDP-N-acetylglucosamine 2-epimerase (non-hydrolysing)